MQPSLLKKKAGPAVNTTDGRNAILGEQTCHGLSREIFIGEHTCHGQNTGLISHCIRKIKGGSMLAHAVEPILRRVELRSRASAGGDLEELSGQICGLSSQLPGDVGPDMWLVRPISRGKYFPLFLSLIIVSI